MLIQHKIRCPAIYFHLYQIVIFPRQIQYIFCDFCFTFFTNAAADPLSQSIVGILYACRFLFPFQKSHAFQTVIRTKYILPRTVFPPFFRQIAPAVIPIFCYPACLALFLTAYQLVEGIICITGFHAVRFFPNPIAPSIISVTFLHGSILSDFRKPVQLIIGILICAACVRPAFSVPLNPDFISVCIIYAGNFLISIPCISVQQPIRQALCAIVVFRIQSLRKLFPAQSAQPVIPVFHTVISSAHQSKAHPFVILICNHCTVRIYHTCPFAPCSI